MNIDEQVPIIIALPDLLGILRSCAEAKQLHLFDFLLDAYLIADCGAILASWQDETEGIQ